MSKKKSSRDAQQRVVIRLRKHLLGRVDAYRSRMADGMPGVTISRAEAIRALLHEALDVTDSQAARR